MKNYSMEENYRFFIESEWKDIHHSRVQEWSALALIATIHIGLVQLVKLINDTLNLKHQFAFLIPMFCIIALVFSFLGILMVCRHRRLMWIKLNWIFDAEEKLGLIKNINNPVGIVPEDYRMKKYSKAEYENEVAKERKLKSKNSMWSKLMWPRMLSTSWLMVMLYILFIIIDFGVIVYLIF